MTLRFPAAMAALALAIVTPFAALAAPVTIVPAAKVSLPSLGFGPDCKAKQDGATDDSTPMANCQATAAALGGAGIVLGSGIQTGTFLFDTAGVALKGQCWGVSARSYPTGGYLQTPTVSGTPAAGPVIQIGNDDKLLRGVLFDCLDLSGGGNGAQYGLKVSGGAYDITLDRIRALGFLGYQVGVLGGTAYSSAHVHISHSDIEAYPCGSVGLEFVDSVSGATFNNDHTVSDTYLGSAGCSQSLVVDSSWFGASNLKSDGGNMSVMLRSNASSHASPVIHCGGLCNFDNAGNGGLRGLTVVYDMASNSSFSSLNQAAGLGSPFDGAIQINGHTLVTEQRPTITTTLNATTATLSSVTGVYAGMIVAVQTSAGSIPSTTVLNWHRRVLSVNTGTNVVTWDPVYPAGATSPVAETNAQAYVGYTMDAQQVKMLANQSIYDLYACEPLQRALEPRRYETGNCGNLGDALGAPWNGYNTVDQFGSTTYTMLFDVKQYVSPTSVSMTNNEVVVGYSGLGVNPGDLLQLWGANEAGLGVPPGGANGGLACTIDYPATSNFYFTCPANGSFSNVTSATGNLKITAKNKLTFSKGTIIWDIGQFPQFSYYNASTGVVSSYAPLSSGGGGSVSGVTVLSFSQTNGVVFLSAVPTAPETGVTLTSSGGFTGTCNLVTTMPMAVCTSSTWGSLAAGQTITGTGIATNTPLASPALTITPPATSIILQCAASLVGTASACLQGEQIGSPYTSYFYMSGAGALSLGTCTGAQGNGWGHPNIVVCDAGGVPSDTAAAGVTQMGFNAGMAYLTAGGSSTANPVGEKVAVPATSSSTCVLSQWAADTSYHYDCVAANTWRRIASSTF